MWRPQKFPRSMAVLRLNLLAVFLFLAPWRTTAQQRYNSTDGYACNGAATNCSTFAMYRTFQAEESLQAVGSYFNTNKESIANVSDLAIAAMNAPLPQGHALYIPLNCRCENGTSQMPVKRTIAVDDTFWLLSVTIYGGLTKYQAMERFNPTMDAFNLTLGDTIRVPIFCACPTTEQVARGTALLLTYAVYADETLEAISRRFGITAADLSAANQVSENETLGQNTTLLVPLASLPPIATLDLGRSPAPNPSTVSSERRKVGLIAGLCTGGILALLLVGGFFVARRRRRKRFRIDDPGDLVDHARLHVPRMFTFKELSKATRSFSSSEMLGRGGFGAVYKGTLPSGVVVAVKRMRNESKHGKESFQAEVASLSHIRHRNLVQLRGWCHEEEQLLLVYEYMCNGSLDQWIFQKEAWLSLDLRRSVVSGLAAALAYLHEECPQCVLHRDIKCSNVLLDGEWNAYLGDFGLARLIDHQKMEKTTMMAGTFGYMAPEMPHTGKATKESDVYSFGVVMLEVMCGTRALEASAIERGDGTLVDRVWRAHEAGDVMQVADSRILELVDDGGSIEMQEAAVTALITNDVHSSAIWPGRDGAMELSDEKNMLVRNLLHLGLLCCNPNPEARPPMRVVSQLLQGSETMTMSNLPPLSSYNSSWSEFFQPEVVTQASSSDWPSFSVPSVQIAAEGSFQSTHELSPQSGVRTDD